jgi:hypothetical protein
VFYFLNILCGTKLSNILLYFNFFTIEKLIVLKIILKQKTKKMKTCDKKKINNKKKIKIKKNKKKTKQRMIRLR